jgi:hypothetical protein
VTSEIDLKTYQDRVKYLEGKLEYYNNEFKDTGCVSINEEQYMRIAAELLYYKPDSVYLKYLNCEKLMSISIFFPKV